MKSTSRFGVHYLFVQSHSRCCFVQCRNKSHIKELGRVEVTVSSGMVIEEVSQSQLAHFGVRAGAQCNNVFQWRVTTKAEFGIEEFSCTEVLSR